MRTFAIVLFSTVLAAVAAAPLSAAVIPPIGLTPGSDYQLIFVTADIHDALSDDIVTYNTFVSAEAALGVPSGLPSGATWNAVASTIGDDANANAPWLNLPVYNTAGQLVASSGTGIYTGSLDNLVAYDQHGNVSLAAQDLNVWTGSDDQGFGIFGATLGTGSGTNTSEIGRVALDSTWLEFGTSPQSTEILFRKPLYALSTAITLPIPEPGTILLGGFGVLALVAMGWRRKR